jgi:3-hydroxypropanoate dehydrogenase
VDRRFHEHIPQILPIRPEMKEHFESEPAQREAVTAFNGPLQAGYFILGHPAGPPAFDRMPRLDHENALDWA